MKDFYRICETGDANSVEYYNNKRNTVLETIKPICEAVGITDYDYEIDPKKLSETLVVEGTRIDAPAIRSARQCASLLSTSSSGAAGQTKFTISESPYSTI